MKYKKIHICGTYGSGKTTIAKRLSKLLDIPYYSLDDIKYIVKFTIKLPKEKRSIAIEKICSKNNWITEGAWSSDAEIAFKKADLIILIKINPFMITLQIIKRYISGDKGIKNKLADVLKYISKSFLYYLSNNNISYYAHINLINKYNKSFIILKNKRQINNFIKSIL